jgi:type VI secretion system protein ImpF
MATTPVTLSVLDRLIDHEPAASKKVQRRRQIEGIPASELEPPLTRRESENIHRAAVRRDLEWLLNARRIIDRPNVDFEESEERRRIETGESEYEEVEVSVYKYGLPDFSVYGLNSADDADLLVQTIRKTLKVFEPRLTDVKVIPLDVTTSGMRQVRFRIEAKLRMDPASERVSFDTLLELSSGQYQIEGQANAR